MITSSALVLMMTIPGLGLFYGGMVRKKNVLATLAQSFGATALITVLWMVVGYSIALTPNPDAGMNAWIGGFGNLFLSKMTLTSINPLGPTIPESVYMFFQMTFAIITPALIAGALADRMKFSAFLWFMGLWLLLVYCPIAHWVWGGGWLGAMGALDFAGGTVVHLNAGTAALVTCLMLGKRIGLGSESMAPHNLVLSVIGASLLWVGWFGFNAGSAVTAGAMAGMAAVATQIATAAAAIAWTAAEWVIARKPSVLGMISGAVAGLVAITPAAGFVGPMPALVIGVCAGAFCYWMVTKAKAIFKYDDALDAFGVHGAGGTIGALLTGVFAQQAINPIFGAGKAVGGLDGHWAQVGNQLVGVLIAWGIALVGTIVLLKIVDMITGLRVTGEEEEAGLDITQHGEEAYNLEA
jgi:Amt family ammonium transporter